MPQLDKLNFFSQLFWIFLFFFSFYFILVKSYLPLFSKVLKFRTKIYQINKTLNKEYNNIHFVLSDLLLINENYALVLLDSK